MTSPRNGRVRDEVVERFEKKKATELIETLTTISKQAPTMNASGDTATWTFDKAPGTLRLQRIDGRWYLRNR